MTTGQITSLKKELKNWQEIYDSKKNVVAVLAAMALKKKISYKIKNAIVENLVIERDAEYRMKVIKARLGVR